MQYGFIVCLSVVILNAGYCFVGTGTALGGFHFKSRMFQALQSGDGLAACPAFAFVKPLLSRLRCPLPYDYIMGMDVQEADFDRGLPSYVAGEWRDRGCWYYYFYAFILKTPLGTLSLIAMACVTLSPHRADRIMRESCLLLPPAIIVGFATYHCSIGGHSRYLIPALPFVLVWISKVGVFLGDHRPLGYCVGIALWWSVASSIYIYPHSLSYVNELVGGPSRGYRYFANSDIAWGQDLLYLRDWLDGHSEDGTVMVAPFTVIDPRILGLDYQVPPVGPSQLAAGAGSVFDAFGTVRGRFVIDVNYLAGAAALMPDGTGRYQWIKSKGFNYLYFRGLAPVASIGYSMKVYETQTDQSSER